MTGSSAWTELFAEERIESSATVSVQVMAHSLEHGQPLFVKMHPPLKLVSLPGRVGINLFIEMRAANVDLVWIYLYDWTLRF
jgi:hypothetical protein